MSLYFDKQKRRWRIELTRDGKRLRKLAPEGATREEAEAWEAQLVLESFRQRELKQKPDRSLAEAITRWANDDLPKMKSEEAQRSHAAQLIPYVKGYKLTQVHECAAEYVRKNPHLKPATIYQRLAVLRRVAHLAYKKWGWLDQPVGSKIQMPKVQNERHVYATYEEVLTLLIAADSQPLEDLVLIAFYTGMRRGELMGLTRDNIKGNTILLGDPEQIKTGRARSIPIHPALIDAVTRLPIQEKLGWASHAFARLADSVGLGHLHLHDIRHSLASALVQADVPIYTVAHILGHASVKTTQRYAHLATGNMRDALMKVNG